LIAAESFFWPDADFRRVPTSARTVAQISFFPDCGIHRDHFNRGLIARQDGDAADAEADGWTENSSRSI